jgi:hypothetical protein
MDFNQFEFDENPENNHDNNHRMMMEPANQDDENARADDGELVPQQHQRLVREEEDDPHERLQLIQEVERRKQERERLLLEQNRLQEELVQLQVLRVQQQNQLDLLVNQQQPQGPAGADLVVLGRVPDLHEPPPPPPLQQPPEQAHHLRIMPMISRFINMIPPAKRSTLIVRFLVIFWALVLIFLSMSQLPGLVYVLFISSPVLICWYPFDL